MTLGRVLNMSECLWLVVSTLSAKLLCFLYSLQGAENCRQRKMRCEPVLGDADGRCRKCVQLNKRCVLEPNGFSNRTSSRRSSGSVGRSSDSGSPHGGNGVQEVYDTPFYQSPTNTAVSMATPVPAMDATTFATPYATHFAPSAFNGNL